MFRIWSFLTTCSAGHWFKSPSSLPWISQSHPKSFVCLFLLPSVFFLESKQRKPCKDYHVVPLFIVLQWLPSRSEEKAKTLPKLYKAEPSLFLSCLSDLICFHSPLHSLYSSNSMLLLPSF